MILDLPASMKNERIISAWISHGAYMPSVVFCRELAIRDRHAWAIERYIDGQYAGGYRVDEGDYHPTREAAVARAEQLRTEAIRRHEAQIDKLKALDFSPPHPVGG